MILHIMNCSMIADDRMDLVFSNLMVLPLFQVLLNLSPLICKDIQIEQQILEFLYIHKVGRYK